MIDLSIAKMKFYEIKLENGEVIHLKAPSYGLFQKIQQMDGIEDVSVAISLIYETTREIMNNNVEHVVVENIEGYAIDVCLLIIKDYFDFYQTEMNKVSFHPSQQMKN